jgi:dihydrofolate reductase
MLDENALVGSLINLGMIDELRLMMHPIVLGGGKALSKGVKERQTLKLLWTKSLKSGRGNLTCSTRPSWIGGILQQRYKGHRP